jgi:glycerophosphoryl diester phosphodiesterase
MLLGHRGARHQKSVSENTIAGFDFALDQGCDGFEFDVRLSGDGEPVIVHDATVGNLHVAKTAAAKLPLPLFRQVLARYQSKAFLDIELKVAGLERITSELLREFPPKRGFVISSFVPELLVALRDLDPEIPLGLICETQSQLERWQGLPIEYVIAHYRLVKPDIVEDIKSVGTKVMVWTVNLAADMKRFSQMMVDGIISDDPKKLVSALRGIRSS